MSVEALSWAYNIAPIPMDKGRNGVRKPSAPCHAVLNALANSAGADGTNAFPSIRRLMLNTSLGERTVQDCLKRLEADEIIRPGNPDVVAAYIRRADKRPQNWDLAMDRVNPDLTDDDIAMLASQFAGLAERVQAAREARDASDLQGQSGVRVSHPGAETPGDARFDGVRVSRERGASLAPEPYKQPPKELPTDRTPSCQSAGTRTRETASGVPCMPQDLPVELHDLFAEAHKLADEWWKLRKKTGVVLGGRVNSKGQVTSSFCGLVNNLVFNALKNGATVNEVKWALNDCDDTFPPKPKFERALRNRRNGTATRNGFRVVGGSGQRKEPHQPYRDPEDMSGYTKRIG